MNFGRSYFSFCGGLGLPEVSGFFVFFESCKTFCFFNSFQPSPAFFFLIVFPFREIIDFVDHRTHLGMFSGSGMAVTKAILPDFANGREEIPEKPENYRSNRFFPTPIHENSFYTILTNYIRKTSVSPLPDWNVKCFWNKSNKNKLVSGLSGWAMWDYRWSSNSAAPDSRWSGWTSTPPRWTD